MKESVVKLWCDRHAADDERVEASVTRVVAVDGLAPRTLDLCAVCDKELFDTLYALLVEATDATIETRSPRTTRCEICGRDNGNRKNLIDHVYRAHTDGKPRHDDGVCPACHNPFKGHQAVMMHLTSSHGYDALADAYARAQAAAR